MTEWRDISTAPKDGTEILVYWFGSRTYAVVAWHGEWLEGDAGVSGFTHWRPLPEPPVSP